MIETPEMIVATNEATGHELVLMFCGGSEWPDTMPDDYFIVSFINRTTQEIREQTLHVERFRKGWRDTARRRLREGDQNGMRMVPHFLVSYVPRKD